MIRFCLNGNWVEETQIDPNWTVLRYLRTKTNQLAAKEGCAGGDCGACSILVGTPQPSGMQYMAINACISLLGSLDGKYVITVEGLKNQDQLHPVQQAMVDHHGSQCGFCTPGIVASLAALYHNQNGQAVSEHDIHVALSGNLCRCTGYRPIIDAAKAMHNYPAPSLQAAVMKNAVQQFDPQHNSGAEPAMQNDGRTLYTPENEAQLCQLLSQHNDAVLWAGGTDLGLEITQQFKQFTTLISLHKLASLTEVSETENEIRVGAMVTYSNALSILSAHFPAFAQLLDRIGSRQIRNLGTIGGNVANGSPIGDTPPVLFALNTKLQLASAGGVRVIGIEDFFKGYKHTDLQAGEYLQAIIIPKLSVSQSLHVFKVSKRKEDDISAVLMAAVIEHDRQAIKGARIACGGMAATPLRALKTEHALIGKPLTLHSFEQAAAQISHDYSPIQDVRASVAYRLNVASNLVIKTGIELIAGGLSS